MSKGERLEQADDILYQAKKTAAPRWRFINGWARRFR
jgi:hypothetical protein